MNITSHNGGRTYHIVIPATKIECRAMNECP
jgi:hypothetical protein